MEERNYVLFDGTIVKESELTPEMRKQLCLDDEDDYELEYESIDDIARGEGFWIDEDGHWRELDEDDEW